MSVTERPGTIAEICMGEVSLYVNVLLALNMALSLNDDQDFWFADVPTMLDP